MGDWKQRARFAVRIPDTVKSAIVQRRDCQARLHLAEANLRAALAPYAGQTFEVEGVPVKVCGNPGALYLRRITGPEETARLREEWRRS